MGLTLDGFDPVFQNAVNQLLAACPGSTIGGGSRTRAEQQDLYNKLGPWSPSNPGAARPGTSNHEVGVGHGAADLRAGRDGFTCLHSKAPQFGLHFPLGNEPWHVEPTDELVAQYGQDPGQPGQLEQAEPENPLDAAERIIFGGETLDADAAVQEKMGGPEPVAGAEDSEFVPQASAGFSGSGQTSDPKQLAAALYRAGFRGQQIITMLAIAKGESGWDSQATGDTSLANGTWGPSVGAFQIRTLRGEMGTGGWRDERSLRGSLDHQAKAAFAISNGGTNFRPWTVFSKGIYQQHLGEARKAVGGGIPAGQRKIPPGQRKIPPGQRKTGGYVPGPTDVAAANADAPIPDFRGLIDGSFLQAEAPPILETEEDEDEGTSDIEDDVVLSTPTPDPASSLYNAPEASELYRTGGD